MPQGRVAVTPDDGLTTRQRRNRPLLVVHTGEMKGKSTAAFGMAMRAWNQGWPVAVYQFVKSAKWKVGEENALTALGRQGTEVDHAADAAEGWAQIKRDLAAEAHRFYVLDEFTYPLSWGWVDVDDVVQTLRDRPGTQHVVVTGRNAPPALVEAADLVVEMTKVKHPMDAGQKGQRGIEW
jgi:cob(I)alamin adenosyltransferase